MRESGGGCDNWGVFPASGLSLCRLDEERFCDSGCDSDALPLVAFVPSVCGGLTASLAPVMMEAVCDGNNSSFSINPCRLGLLVSLRTTKDGCSDGPERGKLVVDERHDLSVGSCLTVSEGKSRSDMSRLGPFRSSGSAC